MATGEKLRSDLVISPQDGFVVVKDPVAGQFFRFREVEYFVASQFDGFTSLGEVRERTERKFGVAPTPDVTEGFVATLRRLGLLETMGAGHDVSASRARRVRGDLLHLRLSAFDPDAWLGRLVGKLGFFFTPYFVALSAPFIVLALGIAIGQRTEIAQDLARLLRIETLPLAWVAIFVVAAAHEFAHGLTCKHFGGRVREMGFLLIYFQTAFYCNVSDAWLFPEKSKRLLVTLAGPYFELVVWALAVLTWRFTGSDGWLNAMALVVVATSGVRLIVNLNPLIKLDGYYLLGDAIGIPNLRTRAFRYVGDQIARVWGAPALSRGESSPRERRIYLMYGLLAGGYSAWLLGSLAWALGRLLTGGYQGTGAILSAGLLVAAFQRRLRRLVSRPAPVQACRGRLEWVKRPAKVLVALGAGLAVLFLGRVELTVSGKFTVAPRQQHVNRLAGPEAVTAEIAVSEKDIRDVRIGLPVALEARALPEKSFVGRVAAVAPARANGEEDSWRGRVTVTTVIDDADLLLKPLMTGNAKIYCGERRIFDLLTRRRVLDNLTRPLARILRSEARSSW